MTMPRWIILPTEADGTYGLVQYAILLSYSNNEGPEVAAIEGSGETKAPESMLTGRSF
jgi:hypothetical protein